MCQVRKRPQSIMEIYGQGLSSGMLCEPVFHAARHPHTAFCSITMRQHSSIAKPCEAKALRCEKSSTLNAGILSFIKAKDAGGLAPVKDDNAEKGQKIKFKAGSYSVPLLKRSMAQFRPKRIKWFY